jgi:hypothetical protein
LNTFREGYFRLKFSLSKRDYQDLLDQIRQDNSTLIRLTKQSLALEPIRKSRSHPFPNFKVVRECAKSFYAILCCGWRCNCREAHTVSLRLEPRINDTSVSIEDGEILLQKNPFRVVFTYTHTTSSLESAPWLQEEADVRLIDEQLRPSRPSDSVADLKQSKREVRFQDHAMEAVRTVLNAQTGVTTIQDLCKAVAMLRQPQRDMCLKILVDDYSRRNHGILIYRLEASVSKPKPWTIVSLENILSQKDQLNRPFTRSDRLHLAVTLASSVLQLHQTPWLDESWSKKDIFFIRRGDQVFYEHPFVCRRFSANSDAIVDRDTRTSFLFIRNGTVFALGIVLIELWYGKPLDELRVPADCRNDPTLAVNSDYVTADRLANILDEEAGCAYASAVRRCVRCDFGTRETTLEDIGFRKAVFDGVVTSLEKTLVHFTKPWD